MTHDGLGKYVGEIVEKAPGADRRRRRDPARDRHRRRRELPAGRLRRGDEVVRRADPRRGLRDGELHARLHRAARTTGAKRFEDAGLPIIGDDIKSQVGATISHRVLTTLFRKRGVRLDRTYQLNFGGNSDFLNMLEREPAGVEEDLEDELGQVDARLRPRRGQHPHRALRPRAVARGPQVGLHPARGNVVRRRAAQHRAEARGARLAELGRDRDRRRPAREAGPEQRHLRSARRAVGVLHEVAAASSTTTTSRTRWSRTSSARTRGNWGA